MQFFQTLWQLVLKEIRSLLGDKVMIVLIIAMKFCSTPALALRFFRYSTVLRGCFQNGNKHFFI